MRSRLHALAVRLSIPALLCSLGLVVAPAHAEAATIVYECRSAGIGCISFSGYAGKSVWGYPVNSTGNNCVNYAAYRMARNGVPQQSGLGNGGSWATNARSRGFRVDATPATGSIAQWNYGSHYAPSNGHVGYVEEVTSSYITISDSSWSGGSNRWRIPRGDANWPSNFIHFRDVGYQPPPSGSFVRVREGGAIYRLVGRSPIYVSTWNAFGGAKPTHDLAASSLNSLPWFPAEGSFIRGAQRGEVFRIAGGSPLYVSTYTAFGGAQPTVTVDQVAIDRAGSGSYYNHLRAKPPEGTYLRGAQRGEVYRVAGGAPVYISSWANVGGTKPTMTVDQVAIDLAGTAARHSHLRHKPVTGAYLQAHTTKRVYKMSGGIAYYVSSWTQVGGPKPVTWVDQEAVTRAGTPSPTKWTHIADERSL